LPGRSASAFPERPGSVNANIKDPNTLLDKHRKISLTFEFVPYKDRSGAAVVCSVDTKLSPVNGVDSTIYLKKIDGVIEAFTQDTSQLDLFEGETEAEQQQKEAV